MMHLKASVLTISTITALMHFMTFLPIWGMTMTVSWTL